MQRAQDAPSLRVRSGFDMTALGKAAAWTGGSAVLQHPMLAEKCVPRLR